MSRELLKEAIADAKAVKETAIANAKAALEESFTPHLKSMIANKLAEMDKEDEIDETKDAAEEKDSKDANIDRESDAIRDDADQISKLAKDAGEDAEDIKDKVSDDRAIDAVRDDLDQISKLAKDAGEDAGDVKVDEELDLDEILRELRGKKSLDEKEYKQHMTKKEKGEGDDRREDDQAEEDAEKMRKIDEEDESRDERADVDKYEYEKGKDAGEDDDADEDVEIDLDNLTEDDLKAFIEDVIGDMVETGEIEAGEEAVEDEDIDIDVDEDSEEEIEIGEAKEDEDIKEDKDEELEEAYATIRTLKTDLNEINLLNSKLLFTNKIFRAKNLTEAQKIKVLGAFDKASSVKEAKLVYETLNAGVANKKHPVNEVKGRASKAIRPVDKVQPIVESDQMVARFKKLAGLI